MGLKYYGCDTFIPPHPGPLIFMTNGEGIQNIIAAINWTLQGFFSIPFGEWFKILWLRYYETPLVFIAFVKGVKYYYGRDILKPLQISIWRRASKYHGCDKLNPLAFHWYCRGVLYIMCRIYWSPFIFFSNYHRIEDWKYYGRDI